MQICNIETSIQSGVVQLGMLQESVSLFQPCPKLVSFGAPWFLFGSKHSLFTFLALITFLSCPSHLLLKSSSLSNYSSFRSCFIPPIFLIAFFQLYYIIVFKSHVYPQSACILFSHLFSISLPVIAKVAFATLMSVKTELIFSEMQSPQVKVLPLCAAHPTK